jgi:hypothetical protein
MLHNPPTRSIRERRAEAVVVGPGSWATGELRSNECSCDRAIYDLRCPSRKPLARTTATRAFKPPKPAATVRRSLHAVQTMRHHADNA